MRDGRLAPHGPSFKALVLNNASQVTRQSFADISRLADSGLPIVIVGQPIPYPSSDAIDSNALSAGVNALLTKPNVRRASVGTVASVLADLGIAPSVTVRSQGLWYTSWRDSDSDKSSTLFVLGDTKATAGEIELETNRSTLHVPPSRRRRQRATYRSSPTRRTPDQPSSQPTR